MPLDLDNIETSFIELARDGVGHLLSCIKPNTPSVIRSLTNGVVPDFPFVELSVDGVSQTDGYLFNKTINDEGDTVYDTFYKVRLRYTVFGRNSKKKKSAINIAQELESYFRLDHVLAEVEQKTTGTLESTSDIIPSPVRLATEFAESAYFIVTMNVNDCYVNKHDGYFDTIELEGEVKRHPYDPDPFLFELTETSRIL